jgi:hypothetical protein
MEVTTATLTQWLDQAHITETALTPEQSGLLQAAWHFRQTQGTDYYSTRLLSHFLLHCNSGLKVAQIARLLGLCRTTASRQQGLSSKEALQAAQHRLAGRPYGKLLPRYAGPIAEYVITHPQATRYDTLAFIHQTFGVHVSTVALFKYLKKYGLDQASLQAATAAAQPAEPLAPSPAWPDVEATPAPGCAGDSPPPTFHSSPPAGTPAPPFSSGTRIMPVPSCFCPRP